MLSSIEDCIPAHRPYARVLLSSPQDLVHNTLFRALDKLHTRRKNAEIWVRHRSDAFRLHDGKGTLRGDTVTVASSLKF